jgi:hypothetical protein
LERVLADVVIINEFIVVVGEGSGQGMQVSDEEKSLLEGWVLLVFEHVDNRAEVVT